MRRHLPILSGLVLATALAGPAGAQDLVLRHVHYVARSPAGAGAAREICEFLMRAQGTLEAAHARYLA